MDGYRPANVLTFRFAGRGAKGPRRERRKRTKAWRTKRQDFMRRVGYPRGAASANVWGSEIEPQDADRTAGRNLGRV
jgi:hypothetical protein